MDTIEEKYETINNWRILRKYKSKKAKRYTVCDAICLLCNTEYKERDYYGILHGKSTCCKKCSDISKRSSEKRVGVKVTNKRTDLVLTCVDYRNKEDIEVDGIILKRKPGGSFIKGKIGVPDKFFNRHIGDEVVSYDGYKCKIIGGTYGAVLVQFEDGDTKVVTYGGLLGNSKKHRLYRYEKVPLADLVKRINYIILKGV